MAARPRASTSSLLRLLASLRNSAEVPVGFGSAPATASASSVPTVSSAHARLAPIPPEARA